MSRKRILTFFLAALMLISLATPAFAGEGSAPRSNGHPYFIAVNRRMNTVTVYALDEEGSYTVPVRAMLCSTGEGGENETPLGDYSVTYFRSLWLRMVDGSYGRYCVQFWGNYLFHSVCYRDDDPSTLITEEYNDLGSSVSHGCVRLQTADAKWLYENIEQGTKVRVYEDDEPGPLGRPAAEMGYISEEADNGWDPTDPDENNPWKNIRAASLTLEEKSLTMETGLTASLHAAVTAESTVPPETETENDTENAEAGTPEIPVLNPGWTSSAPAVVRVDCRGGLTALKPGKAVITARIGGFTAECIVTVEGEVLPFSDVAPGAWYYGQVRYAYEAGMMRGMTADTFAPDGTLTMAQAVQLLYQLAGSPEVKAEAGDAPWYAAALHWAEGLKLIDLTDFDPQADAPREEFIRLLYLYRRQRTVFPANAYGELDAFPDSADVSESALEAMRWAVGADIIHGSDGLLIPRSTLTRAQAATIAENCFEYGK